MCAAACAGDLIKVLSIGDEETSSTLPQIIFHSRVDDIIDISGFMHLGEKEIWKAIHNTCLPYEDWTVRKEGSELNPLLHVSLELTGNHHDDQTVSSLINDQLKNTRKDYQGFKEIINLIPIKVTLLKQGTFQRYMKTIQSEGFEIAYCKLHHINPSDTVLNDLLKISASL